MSRNLYKLIQEQNERLDKLERENRLLQNQVDALETLLRIKDKIPERPFYPQPESPWYKFDKFDDSEWWKNYKITAQADEALEKAKKDPFVKLMCDSFGL